MRIFTRRRKERKRKSGENSVIHSCKTVSLINRITVYLRTFTRRRKERNRTRAEQTRMMPPIAFQEK
jgi:hypothetical protein